MAHPTGMRRPFGSASDPEIKRAILSDAEGAENADIIAAVFRKSDQVMHGLWAEWWRKAKAVRQTPVRQDEKNKLE